MKVLTKNLIGAQLDWAVESRLDQVPSDAFAIYSTWRPRKFSTDWALGGPLFEREISNHERRVDYFYCNKFVNGHYRWATGPTLLIAAMRCYVASKLGHEIEIPEALV